jgi:prolyl oligopeptidase
MSPTAILAALLATQVPAPPAPGAPAAAAPPAASGAFSASAPAAGSLPSAALPGAPRAARRPVTDAYHGVEVVDPYRWLENPADPEVKAWSEAQGAAARAWLDGLPSAKAIRDQVAAIVKSRSAFWFALVDRPGGLFAEKSDPAKQQPMLVRLPSADAAGKERVLLDPAVLDPTGKTAIDWYVPSLDGRRVAVSLSRGGTESGDVQVFDVAGMKPVGPPIRRVHGGTAGGSVAWNADGTGFWYTRYPREGERPKADLDFFQQVWFHRIGTPEAQDRKELGDELPRIAEVRLATKRDGKWVLALVANGDGGEHELWLRPTGKGAWRRVSRLEDKVVQAAFGNGPEIFLVSRKDAPRGRVLRLPLPPPAGDPAVAGARVVVPEGEGAIEAVIPARTRLYVEELVGGPSRLRMVALDGKPLGDVPIPPVSAVGQVVRLDGDDVLLLSSTYLAPPAWLRYAAKGGKLSPTALRQTSPVDLSGAEVVRGWAVSRDGTRIPVDVLRMKGTALDGDRPTVLYGYGGYGISMTPSFSGARALWLQNGGVYAIAALRGGGEFGEAWHLAGNLTRKQNVFDDFVAAAEWLVKEKVTRPERLAVLGGSNGGLLVNAVLTQRPELFRAAVSLVGISDMLRVEATPNGAFNVTEFGTVKDPGQFQALHAYSPLHRVADGTRYPAVLLTAGENDPRVDSWHAKKMAARLQEASASGRPVVLRLSAWGHGMGSSRDEAIAQAADTWAFLFAELAVPFRPIPLAVPAAGGAPVGAAGAAGR